MIKYWNPRRIKRIEERKNRAAELAAEKTVALRERARSYTPGNTRKNTALMLNALGLPLRRLMIERLKRGGAMSVSKLAEPFRITLPSALQQVRILERSGIITTHKRGRIRFCVYEPQAMRELIRALASGELGCHPNT